MELLISAPDLDAVRAHIFAGTTEGCAVLYTRRVVRPGRPDRHLVAQVIIPSVNQYFVRTPTRATLSPAFVAIVTKTAASGHFGLVFVHSHRAPAHTHFSQEDDRGEAHLRAFLARREFAGTSMALLLGTDRMDARLLGTLERVRVIAIGATRTIHVDDTVPSLGISDEHDRQVRAFGSEAQAHLRDLAVGIVGLGGTGSLIAQLLAHLGVGSFLLIDPDQIERSNLNRVANATPEDVGNDKVDVAARYIRRVNPRAVVDTLAEDVVRSRVARRLGDLDFIFGCTDSHGSRSVLQQVAYQYLVPCIDMGAIIVMRGADLSHVHGRVQLLAPGLPCLACSGLLDATEVRRDLMTPLERKSDPYIIGAREPAPAVMSLNATVASLAINMLLATVAGLPDTARHLHYSALGARLRRMGTTALANCYICSPRDGVLARGDDTPLMARHD